jgi:hypothetical protein
MGRTACTEPQCLYSRAIPLLPLWAVRPVQSLSACTRVHFIFTFTHVHVGPVSGLGLRLYTHLLFPLMCYLSLPHLAHSLRSSNSIRWLTSCKSPQCCSSCSSPYLCFLGPDAPLSTLISNTFSTFSV